MAPELLFIHHDRLYQATADGTRVHGTFEVPYEAHIESRSYIKVYLSHADVSPDGTRVAYSVCWDSFTFWDSPPREPPDEESREIDAPIGTVFFEVRCLGCGHRRGGLPGRWQRAGVVARR